MSELLRRTLTELTALLRAKEASPVEVMEATLERIDATHGRLNALVAQRDADRLLDEARAAERRIVRGEGRPLEGIPFGVKDLEDAAGLVTSHGSRLFRDNVASEDSTQVARLKRAGAIVVGKTNAPEFGHTAITKNLIHGVTRSPWGTDRTPGGSSGGSASLVAAEAMPLVTASDGGGSIRIPASFTGCFGLKPTHGRIPRGPFTHWDYDVTAAYGPLTKTVQDAALILDQLVGPDPRDPWSLPHPGVSYVHEVGRPLDPLRIAYSAELGYAIVQSDVAETVREAVTVFEDLGHSITEIRGGPPELGAAWGLLGAWQLGSQIAHLLPERREDLTRGLLNGIEMAQHMTMQWWGESAKARIALVDWVADVFANYDLLLTPTVPYDPPAARGPLPTETEGRKQLTASVASFTIPFNLSWNPAATVRAGLSKAGLPVGLQLVGPRHRDDICLRAARAFERERPAHPHWPLRS